MNIVKWIVLLSGIQILSACATATTTVPEPGTAPTPDIDINSGVNDNLPPVQLLDPNFPDDDRDGITNVSDRCAGSTSASLVDDSGCEVTLGVIDGLKFAPNETKLSIDSRVVLSQLVDVFKRYPELSFSVEGHTDNRGTAADNLELSKQRVLSVVRYMVANGISAERIRPFGYGESRPRAANATAEGREQNRRIEINKAAPLL